MQSWLIKVLNGPHAGAEMPLAPGSYRIGGDGDCDLILHDPDGDLEPVHLVIDAGARLVPPHEEGGDDAAGQRLQTFQPFQLGKNRLVLGPAEELWPNPLPNPATHSLPETTPATPSVAGVRKAAVLGVVVLLAVLAVRLPHGVAEPAPTQSEVVTLHDLPQQLNLDHVTLAESEDGGPRLSGWVADRQQRDHLKRTLTRMQVKAELDLVVIADLLRNSQAVLDQHGLSLHVAISPDGVLRLSGNAEQQPLDAALAALEREVPGLAAIETAVTTETDHIANLNARLAQLRHSRLAAGKHKGTVTVAGHLHPADADRWVAIRAAWRNSHKATADLVERFSRLNEPEQPAKTAAPSFTSLHIGRVRYLRFADGHRVFEGGLLPNGSRVMAIHHDHLLLRAGGQTRRHPIGTVAAVSTSNPKPGE